MLTVLLGGARSGKSSLAVDLAERDRRGVTFLATSPEIPGDDDLAARVARHRRERPAGWATIEEELDLAGALSRVETAIVILDCLTVWVGSMLHHGRGGADIDTAGEAAIAAIRDRSLDAIVVSSEVGLGVIPSNDLAREYRDLLGRVNQRWVAASDKALMLIAGRALPLHDPSELLR